MLRIEWGAESNGKLPHLFIPSKTATQLPEFAMEDLPLGRISALVPESAVKDLPLGRTLMIYIYIYIYIKFNREVSRKFDIIFSSKKRIFKKTRDFFFQKFSPQITTLFIIKHRILDLLEQDLLFNINRVFIVDSPVSNNFPFPFKRPREPYLVNLKIVLMKCKFPQKLFTVGS